jgi:hypothetical protein
MGQRDTLGRFGGGKLCGTVDGHGTPEISGRAARITLLAWNPESI